jgi:hypothetical protein
MRAFAVQGRFPLVEAAQREGRPALALAASVQTFASLAFLVAIGTAFARRGFSSSRLRGWSSSVWVFGFFGLCAAPSIFPGLSAQLIDYAVTSSYGQAGDVKGLAFGGPFTAIFGPEGLNRRMEPAVFIVERALLVVFVGAMAAVLCHDIGYNFREGLDNAGWFKGARAASSGRPMSKASDDAQSQRADEAPGFGHRASFRDDAVKSVQGQACELLGVRLGATTREIERAWREKMKGAHPDHGGSQERAVALNQARDLLLRRG